MEHWWWWWEEIQLILQECRMEHTDGRDSTDRSSKGSCSRNTDTGRPV